MANRNQIRAFLFIIVTALFFPALFFPAPLFQMNAAAQTREVRVVSVASASAGQTVNVPIEIAAQGNEAAIGFTLTFNPAVLSAPVATLGGGATGATIFVNSNSAASGLLGVSLAMPIGQTIPAGARQLVAVSFSVAANAPAGTTPIGFSDQLAKREVSDANANVLPATFTAGTVTIVQSNPVPTITAINPASVIAGASPFTLTVTGTNFLNTSVVRWNGANRPTTFVSATQLTAQIPASDVAAATTVVITVQSPAPGGGVSNEVQLRISALQVAQITISPASPTTNDDITINLSGTWPNGCVPQNPQLSLAGNTLSISTSNTSPTCTQALTNWNLSVRQSKLPAGSYTVSASHRDAANNLHALGQANFSVTNLAPSIAGLNPSSATAGGPAFTLTVTGSNFSSASIVRWNDADRPTTFVSETQLRASIAAADIAAQGAASVKVFTPAPGGGTTNALPFVVSGSLASVSAASFAQGDVASESIIAAFGGNLATRVEVATTVPLPTELAGTRLRVKDSAGTERLAPLFFVAPGQINYQMPPGTAAGTAMISVTSSDDKLSLGTARIASVAPGLFSASATGQGVAAATVLRVKVNGEQSFEAVARFDAGQNRFVFVPIDLGPETDQLFLVLSGTGLRFHTALAAVNCKIGGTDAEVLYAGETPGLIGLDQANVRIPRSLAGRGEIDVVLTVDGKVANAVRVNIK